MRPSLAFAVGACALWVWLATVSFAGAAGNGSVDRLAELYDLEQIMTMIRDEGLAEGDDLDAAALNGRGGDFWAAQVARIYDVPAMERLLRQTMAEEMSAAEIAGALAFFDTGRGRHILALEIAARQAISDSEVEAAARARYDDLLAANDARLAAIQRYVTVNDMIERNLAGSIESNLAFYRGMIAGGAPGMDEATIVEIVTSQRDEIRSDTEDWLQAFLLMAYTPLDRDDMLAYVAFAESPPGQALNDALHIGFDRLYHDVSFALGRSLARAMAASDL